MSARAGERFHSELDWLDSWHSFSFGTHYDPKNTHHGLLLVHNDDVITPGAGFGTHAHRDMEIVTWVLEGAVEHRDSEGNHGVIRPGLAQRMSAGRGIRHSEMNASATEPVHFLQMWVPPTSSRSRPNTRKSTSRTVCTGDVLVPVASGREPGAAISDPPEGRDAVGRPSRCRRVRHGAGRAVRACSSSRPEAPISTATHSARAMPSASPTPARTR